MRVNEIFYSIQGEGFHTGRAAVFVRFSGCNLKCPFCDTDFDNYEKLSEEEIVDECVRIGRGCHFVVITGGEPTLQVTASLIDKFHEKGFFVSMESNGTRKPPFNVDWLTISPKSPFVGEKANIEVSHCQELKVVFDIEHPVTDYTIEAELYYLQPCDTGNQERNKEIINALVDFVKKNPKWKISLQTQKMLAVR